VIHMRLNEAIQGASVVFHLAGVGRQQTLHRRSAAGRRSQRARHAPGARSRAPGARGSAKLVASSVGGASSESLKTLPIREDHPVEPDTPVRQLPKLCAEKALSRPTPSCTELDAVCLRYFNVYGPNQRFDAYGQTSIPIFAFSHAARGAA